MQPIHSGTTTERVVRSAVPTLLVAGFAGALLWDGYVGYPRDNAHQLVRALGVASTSPPPIDRNLSSDAAQSILGKLPVGQPIRQVDAALGAPGLVHGDERYYLGPTGYVRVRHSRDVITEIKWFDGVHSPTDIAVQRWMGFALLPVALVLLIHLIRVTTTRASLTDAGLTLGRKPTIPIGAVKALRVDPTTKGEVVVIIYAVDDGETRIAMLDAYVVKQFTALVAALSERTGLPNPLTDNGSSGPDDGPAIDPEKRMKVDTA